MDPCPSRPVLDLTETSGLGDARNDTRSSSSRSDILALEVGDEAGRADGVEFARAAERVDLASTAQSRRAGRATGAGGENLAARSAGIDGVCDVLEDVALGDDGGAGADFESVAAVGVPVVVDGVEESVAADLGAASAGVVDVVALHGDHVVGAGEVDGPIVVTVAGGAPGGRTVNLAVGDSHAVACFFSKDDVLAADFGSLKLVSISVRLLSNTNTYSNSVNPDHVGAVERDSITAPDVVRVQLGNLDVLDDNVVGAGNDAETLALDHTAATLTQDGLLGVDSDTKRACIVVGNGDRRSARLVVLAPVVLVDGQLACRASAPGSTASTGSGSLSVGEVKGLLQDDDTGGRVAKVRDQLGIGLGVDGRGVTTTSNTFSKAFGGTCDGDGCYVRGPGRERRGENGKLHD